MEETAARPYAVSLLLAGAMCLLPFLVPYHQVPILSFYPEWLAAALGVCAAASVLAWRGARIVAVPAPALWLLAFALFLAARAADPGQAYPQTSFLAALYVLFAALMIWLGAQLASALGLERVAVVLAAFLLAGALANALAGAIQFYGRPELLEDVVAGLSGRRAYGNIAQPNLYANYLALGQSALVLLWLRSRVRSAHALAALATLAAGSALSGSRVALVFALWLALLGYLAGRVQEGAESRRLKLAACVVAAGVLVAHLALPWLNHALHLGPPSEGAFDRMHGETETRWGIYALASQVFGGAPVLGVGVGGFPGAAFELGLDPSLTLAGEIWTSPHDLVLHLLAETGAVGTALALGALGVWGWQAARGYRSDPQVARWWIIAAAGIELIHSLFEFPLWSAHFLGVAALLMGATLKLPTRAVSRAGRVSLSTCSAALSVALAILLVDYVRLDTTRVTGAAVTLASASDARRDAATLRELGRGLMAPVAEYWMFMGARVDRGDLAAKLSMSERVARVWPANRVVVRRAALLALDGDAARARALLERALQAFPLRRRETVEILEMASHEDERAVRPLLSEARPPLDPPK
jgi:Virulence factor membrane-bound polymerase, C-terminal/O-Antigen ligase